MIDDHLNNAQKGNVDVTISPLRERIIILQFF